MVFNKLKFKEIHDATMTSFLIADITYIRSVLIASGLSFEDILIKDNWWTMDATNKSEYIDAHGSEHFPMPKQLAGVRPLCTVHHNELSIGDRFILKNHIFKMIGSDIALCETVIGYTTEDNVINYLCQWSGSLQYNAPINDIIYKIFDCKECECLIEKVTCPGCPVSIPFIFADWITGYEYWTKNRVDEFNCRVIGKTGAIRNDSIFAQHDICPMILFNKENFHQFGFEKHECFEIKGRLFRVMNEGNGTAFCLNTIGFSCFSTGISEIGNEEEEKEYICNAEVTEVINNWLLDVV